jgi:hypothetical protein
MDHEVVPRPCEVCDWLLNSSGVHFDLYQGNNVRLTMEFEVPQKTNFTAYIIHWHGPTGFAVGEAKEVLL